jgi:asparagine synthase (glutamine-hydrolysing)
MAIALEVRCPLLDHRVIEFFWSLPRQLLMQNGRGKLLLRELLKRYVPPALFERQKMGFGVPIESWLRGPLRDWAESLIDESRLRREAIFDPQPIREAWRQHLSGRHNHQYRLWNILMFQAWYERWGAASAR